MLDTLYIIHQDYYLCVTLHIIHQNHMHRLIIAYFTLHIIYQNYTLNFILFIKITCTV